MSRWFLGVAIVCALSTRANASLHTFMCTGASSPNEITILSPGGQFALSDAPDGSGFKYAATAPLKISVTDSTGDVEMDLQFVGVNNNFITMLFRDNAMDPNELRLIFSNTGTTVGDPVPDVFDGRATWDAPSLQPVGTLAGFKDVAVAAVPEPSAFAFGAIAVGLVGLGRYMRRRFATPTT